MIDIRPGCKLLAKRRLVARCAGMLQNFVAVSAGLDSFPGSLLQKLEHRREIVLQRGGPWLVAFDIGTLRYRFARELQVAGSCRVLQDIIRRTWVFWGPRHDAAQTPREWFAIRAHDRQRLSQVDETSCWSHGLAQAVSDLFGGQSVTRGCAPVHLPCFSAVLVAAPVAADFRAARKGLRGQQGESGLRQAEQLLD